MEVSLVRYKKRVILLASLLVFFVASIGVAWALIFAANQQTISGNISVTYVANEVAGTVSATYQVKNEEEKFMTDGEGNTLLVFDGSEKDGEGKSLTPDEDALELTLENNSLVIKYSFTNSGDSDYVAKIVQNNTLENLTMEVSKDGENYQNLINDNFMTVFNNTSDPTSYYVRFTIINLANDVDADINVTWKLDTIPRDTVAVANGEPYSTFDEAMDSVGNGVSLVSDSEENDYEIVSIIKDIESSNGFVINKNILLYAEKDVNINIDSNEASFNVNSGNFIFGMPYNVGEITASCENGFIVVNGNDSEVTLNKGTILAKKQGIGIAIDVVGASAKLNLNNGKIENFSTGINMVEGATMTFDSVKFSNCENTFEGLDGIDIDKDMYLENTTLNGITLNVGNGRLIIGNDVNLNDIKVENKSDIVNIVVQGNDVNINRLKIEDENNIKYMIYVEDKSSVDIKDSLIKSVDLYIENKGSLTFSGTTEISNIEDNEILYRTMILNKNYMKFLDYSSIKNCAVNHRSIITNDSNLFLGEENNYWEGCFLNNVIINSISIPHAVIENNSIFNQYGGTFEGNYVKSFFSNSGVIYNKSIQTIKNAEFKNNGCIEGDINNYGVIYNLGGLSIEKSRFSGNSAKYGSAITNVDTGSVTIGKKDDSNCNVDFVNNTGTVNGGAIFNNSAENSGITIYGGTFDSNSCTGTADSYGGAIYNGVGKITIDKASFSENSALYGGAITNIGTLNIGTINRFANIDFSNNVATLYGAAIFNTGTVTQWSGTYNSNICSDQNGVGGAVYNLKNSSFYYVDFTKNSAYVGGGAIANMGKTLELNSCTFVENESTNGGALYNTASTHILNGKFSNNTATYGGAMFNALNLTLYSGTIEENTATFGGAVYNMSGKLSLLTYNDKDFVTISSNTANDIGGAIYNSSEVYQQNGIIEGNYCTSTTYTAGGAIYNAGTYTIKDGIYRNNGYHDDLIVQDGGFALNAGTFILNGGIFEENKAVVGGAFLDTCALIIDNGTKMIANESNIGGAIYSSGTVRMCGEMIGNISTREGGAIYSNNILEISNGSKFLENEARFGGAIYFDGVNENSSITIANVEFVLNNASANGGAIYLNKSSYLKDSLINDIISNSVFRGNFAAENGGSIMMNSKASIGLSGVVFTNYDENGELIYDGNNAMYGGAVFLAGEKDGVLASAMIMNVSFIGMNASVTGGAMANLGKCNLVSVVFEGCSSKIGGAIANAISSATKAAELTLDKVTISNCVASIGESNGIANLGKLSLNDKVNIQNDIAIIRGMTKNLHIKLTQGSIGVLNFISNDAPIPISFIDATINISITDLDSLDITDFETIEVDLAGTESKQNTTIPSGINYTEFSA